MRSAPLVVACILASLFVSLALTSAAVAQPAAREGYFVEFRARGGGALGHTYIVYGRAGAGGRIVQASHVGLYADESWGYSPMLALALVHGNVTHRREDPKYPTLASFRRNLSAAEYAHLQVTVARLKSSENRWHMWFYNCNDFAAQVARELGMISPLPWMLPTTYVHGLRALNGP
jgi:hypothetical protein